MNDKGKQNCCIGHIQSKSPVKCNLLKVFAEPNCSKIKQITRHALNFSLRKRALFLVFHRNQNMAAGTATQIWSRDLDEIDINHELNITDTEECMSWTIPNYLAKWEHTWRAIDPSKNKWCSVSWFVKQHEHQETITIPLHRKIASKGRKFLCSCQTRKEILRGRIEVQEALSTYEIFLLSLSSIQADFTENESNADGTYTIQSWA